MTTSSGRTYPLRYGAGLFLCCVGMGVAVAALTDIERGNLYLGIGAVLGTVGYFATGRRVVARYGRPQAYQYILLVLVIALEAAAIYAVNALPVFRSLSPYRAQLVVLAIVAVHFMLMRWSLGLWIVWLGVADLAWVALAFAATLALPTVILVFGLLNALFGVLMAAPLFANAEPAPASGTARD